MNIREMLKKGRCNGSLFPEMYGVRLLLHDPAIGARMLNPYDCSARAYSIATDKRYASVYGEFCEAAPEFAIKKKGICPYKLGEILFAEGWNHDKFEQPESINNLRFMKNRDYIVRTTIPIQNTDEVTRHFVAVLGDVWVDNGESRYRMVGRKKFPARIKEYWCKKVTK